ncbi:MAG: hypothetical protein KJ626_01580 [Verrucomicrobia bacterium]|nr:hypothetical protein [Verrucomicrobiota bacterium]
MLELLRAHFRPEFLNRIDETIIFHSLSREDLRAIVDIQLERLAGHLKEHEIHIELTEAARELLIRDGYDSAYGARPLKREIQKKVMNVLAEELLSGRIAAGDRLIADVAKETPDRITFAPAAS